MRKTGVYLLIMMMVMAPILSSCSDKAYVANMKYREHKALYQSSGRAQAMSAITGAINAIIKTVEGDYTAKKEEESKRFVDNSNLDGNNFAVAVLGDIVIDMNRTHAEAEMMRARADAIKYMQPIVESVYRETAEEIGTPPTSMDVALKFVDNLPFLTTVYGMYSLGAKIAESAGTKITNNLNGNGNKVDQSGLQIGNGNMRDGNNTGNMQYDYNNDKSTNTGDSALPEETTPEE